MATNTSRGGVVIKIVIVAIVLLGGLFLILNGYFGFTSTYGWKTYKDESIGIAVKYPEDIFEVKVSGSDNLPAITLSSKKSSDTNSQQPSFDMVNYSYIQISKINAVDNNTVRALAEEGYKQRTERINGISYNWLERNEESNGKIQRSIYAYDSMGNIAISASDDYEGSQKHLMTTTNTIIKTIELH